MEKYLLVGYMSQNLDELSWYLSWVHPGWPVDFEATHATPRLWYQGAMSLGPHLKGQILSVQKWGQWGGIKFLYHVEWWFGTSQKLHHKLPSTQKSTWSKSNASKRWSCFPKTGMIRNETCVFPSMSCTYRLWPVLAISRPRVSKLPFGKLTELWKDPPCYQWVSPLFPWPFSIANC